MPNVQSPVVDPNPATSPAPKRRERWVQRKALAEPIQRVERQEVVLPDEKAG